MVVRRAAFAALAATLLLVPAQRASAATTTLWPGVTFTQSVQVTPGGPVVVDVLTGPRPGGSTTLRTFLTSGQLTQRQTLTAAERELSPTMTLAGINGDFFNFASARPSGVLLEDGQLLSEPSPDRSSAGITADGTLQIGRMGLTSTWQSTGSSHAITAFNRPPGPGGVALFTPAWGSSTPAVPGATAAILFPFPSTMPGVPLGTAVQQLTPGQSFAIPPGGAVLVARGSGAQAFRAEAPAGTPLTVTLTLDSTWAGMVQAIGGGPQIVRNGRAVLKAGEAFLPSQLVPAAPRSGIGQLADGRIILVAVDGRQPGWSVGLTNFQLGQTLARLGAVIGFALDSGGSTTMAFDGTLLNRPSDGRERPISTALAFAYTGALASASLSTVSPNGDGVDDAESLSYKLVRPSTGSVTLTAPDGAVASSLSVDAQEPGTYPVPFPATQSTAQGEWKLTVTATDDLGTQSSMTRSFTVNNAIGFLQTSAPRLFLPPGGRDFTVSWKMGAAAQVVATIETKDGAVVRTIATGRYGVGDRSVVWNGLDKAGKRPPGGVYQAHLVARNALGTMELVKRFTIRQIAGGL
jgi:hypothetical protein